MVSDSVRPGLELRDYLRIVRRKKWLILLAGLLVGGTALGLSLAQQPIYQAHARILLEPTQRVFESSSNQPVDVPTEIQRLQSHPVKKAVQEKVGAAPAVGAIRVEQTQVIRITTEATSPARAAEFANAYAEAYIAYRVQQALDQLANAEGPVREKLNAVSQELKPLQDQINALPLGPQRDAKVLELTPRMNALLGAESTFRSTLDKLQIDAALKSGGVSLVAPATVPQEPVRPNPLRNSVLGISVGLMFGAALVFLFEHLDDSLKTREDLTRTAGHVAVLGVIPAVPGWKNRAEPRLVSREEPSAPSAEAYRSLRTSIQFIGLEHKLQVLQVTSPNASEGKTTTLVNLAVALSQAGQTVAVLSCDLRRPRAHDYFGLPNVVGFTSVLLGESPLSAALQRVPDLPRIVVLASGRLPPNPSELLSSRRTSDVIAALRENVDIILVDSPPVLPVTDAAVLSTKVDGTLMVAMAGQTSSKELSRALETLRNVDTRVVGTILNGATTESGYGYGYSPTEGMEPARNGRRAPKSPKPMRGEHSRASARR